LRGKLIVLVGAVALAGCGATKTITETSTQVSTTTTTVDQPSATTTSTTTPPSAGCPPGTTAVQVGTGSSDCIAEGTYATIPNPAGAPPTERIFVDPSGTECDATLVVNGQCSPP
jgi:hypothetical protein